MASVIKIKRSPGSIAPAALGSGELAYAWDEAGGYANGKLFVGTGAETAGAAANVEIIGGKYFTNMLDHTPGTVVANSALVLDENSTISGNGNLLKIEQLGVNTLGAISGDLTLLPFPGGKVRVGGVYSFPAFGGTEGQILAFGTDGETYWSDSPASTFTITGNSGTDQFSTGESLAFNGTGAISTIVTDNTVTINVASATTTVKGVASFSETNFDVSNGAVSIKVGGVSNSNLDNSSITLGTTEIALGASADALTGLTSVTSTSFTGELTGNASTASKLANPVNVQLTGAVVASSAFDGSANLTLNVSTLNIDSPQVSGLLGTEHGGTGVTTSTGTGSNVLSASPEFTGIPTAPTAIQGSATSQIATTEFVAVAVDTARAGLDAKASVRAATTANINTINTQIVDGVSLAVGNRVLVKNQDNAAGNGIFIVSDTEWTRAPDADNDSNISSGMFTFVEEGTINADTGWVLSSDGPVLLGALPLNFVQFSGAGQIVAGDGLTKTGSTLSVVGGLGIGVTASQVNLEGQALQFHSLNVSGLVARTASNTITAREITGTIDRVSVTNGTAITGNPKVDIASTYVGQSSINTLGTITSGTWQGTGIGVAHGGTGVSTLAARGVVFGNGAGALGVTAASSIAGSFLREDDTGNPYWSNVIDGGTY